MKKNIIRVLFGLLLLCSLLLNAMLTINGVSDRELMRYKRNYCPFQMEAIEKLDDECGVLLKAVPYP